MTSTVFHWVNKKRLRQKIVIKHVVACKFRTLMTLDVNFYLRLRQPKKSFRKRPCIFILYGVKIEKKNLTCKLSLIKRGWSVDAMCWVDFQCRGVLLSWIRVEQGPTALEGGGVWTYFLSSIICLFFLHLSGRRPDIDWNTVSKCR